MEYEQFSFHFPTFDSVHGVEQFFQFYSVGGVTRVLLEPRFLTGSLPARYRLVTISLPVRYRFINEVEANLRNSVFTSAPWSQILPTWY